MTRPEAVSPSAWEAECAAVQEQHTLVCVEASTLVEESAARRREVWRRNHRRGRTLRAIAEAAGVDYSLVWQVLNRCGLAGHPTSPRADRGEQ